MSDPNRGPFDLDIFQQEVQLARLRGNSVVVVPIEDLQWLIEMSTRKRDYGIEDEIRVDEAERDGKIEGLEEATAIVDNAPSSEPNEDLISRDHVLGKLDYAAYAARRVS